MPNSMNFGRVAASYLTCTSPPPSTAFTVMCWAKWTSFSAYHPVFQLWQDSTHLYELTSYAGGSSPSFLETFNGTTEYTPAQNLVAGVWYHVAMTANGSSGTNLLNYFNGAKNGAGSTAISMTATELNIGGGNSGTRVHLGRIAAVKVYSRVLTGGEIAAEMPYALPVSRAALHTSMPVPGAWDVADANDGAPRGALTRWADYSGNNYRYTQTGTIDTDIGPPILWAPPRSLYRGRRRVIANAGGGGTNVLADVGALTLTGFAPTISVSNNQNVLAGVGAATLTGFAPTIAAPRNVLADVGAAILTGFAPTIATPRNVLAGVGAAILSGFAPTVSAGTTAAAGCGVLTVTGFVPTVAAPRSVLAGVGVLTLSGFAPTITIAGPADTIFYSLTGFRGAAPIVTYRGGSPSASAGAASPAVTFRIAGEN